MNLGKNRVNVADQLKSELNRALIAFERSVDVGSNREQRILIRRIHSLTMELQECGVQLDLRIIQDSI